MEKPTTTKKDIEKLIKSFAVRLKKDFGEEFRNDPAGFRSRAVGTFRAVLPRQRPGRPASPEIRRAAEIYQREFKSRGKEANWDQIARQVDAEYEFWQPQLQKYRRFQLRSSVHSNLYEQRSRERRLKATVPSPC